MHISALTKSISTNFLYNIIYTYYKSYFNRYVNLTETVVHMTARVPAIDPSVPFAIGIVCDGVFAIITANNVYMSSMVVSLYSSINLFMIWIFTKI